MSTQKIWDLHMTYDGPVTGEFLERTRELARSIAGEPGILWKIWTIEEGTTRFGSTYLFRSQEDLQTYREMHLKRLASIGINVTSDHIFGIMEEVSAITRAPLSA
ncbi:MAG: monooxygenase [Rhodobacteraceae bacterium]|nr:monooxygenase [Paracoccaceae bacterium]